MALKRTDPLPKFPLNLVYTNGGAADHMYRMLAVNFAVDNYPHLDIHLAVPDYFEEMAKYFRGPRSYPIETHSFIRKHGIPKEGYLRDFENHAHTYLHTHAFHVAARTILDRDIKPFEVTFPHFKFEEVDVSKFKLPKEYVVMTPCFESAVRQMEEKEWHKLAKYFFNKDIHVVWLGSTSMQQSEGVNRTLGSNFSSSIGLDLIDQTTLMEAARIIADADFLIGIDNGLMHLAAFTRTDVFGGYTSVSHIHRNPQLIFDELNGTWNIFKVEPDVSCKFCQSHMLFVKHEFRRCIYNDRKCTKEMTAAKFISQIEEYGYTRNQDDCAAGKTALHS